MKHTTMPIPLKSLALLFALAVSGSGNAATVVEFYNQDLDNYFITADPAEQKFVDSGAVGRWQRTGTTFESGGTNQVCRFYGSAVGPNSHFYTANSQECDNLKATFNAGVKSWKFESYDFFINIPVNGTCGSGQNPVYRAYNNGFARGIDSNHRISTNAADIQGVVAKGWSDEGIVMCEENTLQVSSSLVVSSASLVTSVTDTTAATTFSIPENGTGYWIVSPSASSTPTVAEVMVGKSINLVANTATVIRSTGLAPGSDYNLFFVVKSSNGVVSDGVVASAFKTTKLAAGDDWDLGVFMTQLSPLFTSKTICNNGKTVATGTSCPPPGYVSCSNGTTVAAGLTCPVVNPANTKSSKLDLTKLVSGKQTIKIGSTDLPACSKLASKRQCLTTWGPDLKCTINLTRQVCKAVEHRICADIPELQFADHRLSAYAEINMPTIPASLDVMRTEITKIIEDDVKNILTNHIDRVVSGLKRDLEICTATALGTTIVAAISSSGTAAVPTFMSTFTPCTEVAANHAITKLTDVPSILTGLIANTQSDLTNYFKNMVGDPTNIKLYTTESCGPYHPL